MGVLHAGAIRAKDVVAFAGFYGRLAANGEALVGEASGAGDLWGGGDALNACLDPDGRLLVLSFKLQIGGTREQMSTVAHCSCLRSRKKNGFQKSVP